MKIAFLEYTHTFVNCGDTNFMLNWHKLLTKNNIVDFIQFTSNEKSIELPFSVHNVSQVDINAYDIVIINNLYNSRSNSSEDFMKYIEQISTKTAYINHERPSYNAFLNASYTYRLANICDAVICYQDNMYKVLLQDSDKIHKLKFNHFYKMQEGPISTKKSSDREDDFCYLARISKPKGVNEYIAFMEYANSIFNTRISASLYGYVGTIGNAYLRKIDSMILELSKNPEKHKKNSDSAFIKLRNEVHSRSRVVEILSNTKFSWNAHYFKNQRYDLSRVIDDGLEAAPLESLIYGCIPILNGIHRKLEIPYDANDLTKTVTLEDLNCAVFIDNNDFSSTADQIINEMSYGKLQINGSQFSKIILNTLLYEKSVEKLLIDIIEKPHNRKLVQQNLNSEILSGKKLLELTECKR